MFDQLSLVFQVWGVMLLGAILMLLVLFVTIEWGWIRTSVRRARLAVGQALLRLFTDPDPYPQTADSIARAKHYQAQERQRAGVDEDGQVRLRRGLTAISRSVARPAPVVPIDEAVRRRQLLSLAESSPMRKVVH